MKHLLFGRYTLTVIFAVIFIKSGLDVRASDVLLSYWSLNRAYIGGNETADNYEMLSTSAASYGETYTEAATPSPVKRLRANNGDGSLWAIGSKKPLYDGSEIYISFDDLDPDGPLFGDAATWQGGWTAFKLGGDDAPEMTAFSDAPGNYSLAVGQQTASNIINRACPKFSRRWH